MLERELAKSVITDRFFTQNLFTPALRDQVLAGIEAKAEPRVRAWVIDCGLGEIAYSLATLFKAHLPATPDIRILATHADVDELRLAENGVYPRARWSEIPELYRGAFRLGREAVKDWFCVRPETRATLTFKQHDLARATYPGDRVFDLIVSSRPLQAYENKVCLSAKSGAWLIEPGRPPRQIA